MRAAQSILGLSLLLGLSSCSSDEATPTAVPEAESSEDNGSLSRQDIVRLRSLARHMEVTFNKILKPAVINAFTEREDKQTHETPPFTVTVKDLQLMTPWMKTMRIDQTTNESKEDRKGNRDKGFGAGIVVEVRNDTDKILYQPQFTFGIKISTGYGDRVCSEWDLSTYSSRYNASNQTNPKRPWAAETKGNEMYWRPGEVVRRQITATCANPVYLDTGITGATVALDIGANHLVRNEDMSLETTLMDDVVVVEFPTDALTLRKANLGGNQGYAFGSGTVSFVKGRVSRNVLNAVGMRPDNDQGFESLPETGAPIALKLDELSVSMDGYSLTHWSDVPGAKKGTREFKVNLKQMVDSSTIKARLNTALSAAKAAATSARAASDAANAAVTSAGEDPAAIAAAKKDAAVKAKAATAADRAAAAAQRTYDTGLTKERRRLASALSCDRIRLVTPTRDIALSNAKEVRTACQALAKGDSASAELRFSLPRYEVPLGLTYTMSRKTDVKWIASQATTHWDAR